MVAEPSVQVVADRRRSSAELAAGFTEATGRPWTQPIGFVHALFEVAVDVMKRADDPSDSAAVVAAIAATKLDTIVGPIAWDGDQLAALRRQERRQDAAGRRPMAPARTAAATTSSSSTTRRRRMIPAGGKMEPIA